MGIGDWGLGLRIGHAKIDLSICKDNNINTIGMIIEPKMKKKMLQILWKV